MLPLLLLLALAPPEGGWQEVARAGELVVYNRARPGSELKEVLAVGTFDATPEHVHRVLDDNGRYQDFMPYTKVSRVLRREGDTLWSYERIGAPLVAERDYVVKITHRVVPRADGAVVIEHAFTQANADAPPEQDGVVRVAVLDGRWQLEPLDGGRRTRATYWVYTSPGGSVPTFLVNAANTNAVPGLFDAIQKALPSH